METPAERKAKLKYRKEKRKQIVLELSHDEFEAISNYCDTHRIAKATLIKKLVFEKIGYSR